MTAPFFLPLFARCPFSSQEDHNVGRKLPVVLHTRLEMKFQVSVGRDFGRRHVEVVGEEVATGDRESRQKQDRVAL